MTSLQRIRHIHQTAPRSARPWVVFTLAMFMGAVAALLGRELGLL